MVSGKSRPPDKSGENTDQFSNFSTKAYVVGTKRLVSMSVQKYILTDR